MKKNIAIGLLLAAASSGAFAQQYYKALSERPIYCQSAALASKALHASADEIAAMLEPDTMGLGPSCAILEPDDRFTLATEYKSNPSDDSVKAISTYSLPHSKIIGSPAYLAGYIAPAAAPKQDQGGVPCVPGQPVGGPGGEVDRMEMSKDGTLKLKRYMLTSRCVKGQVRTFFKPLN